MRTVLAILAVLEIIALVIFLFFWSLLLGKNLGALKMQFQSRRRKRSPGILGYIQLVVLLPVALFTGLIAGVIGFGDAFLEKFLDVVGKTG
jgi:uncharacterized membrane protein YobD (UPF0266 family)